VVLFTTIVEKILLLEIFGNYLMPFDGGVSTSLDWLKINKGQAEIPYHGLS
jgi:hypothetical protein